MRRWVTCSVVRTACLFSMSALAGGVMTETADFSGANVPAGWSVSDGVYLSPEYSNAVSRIALSYRATGGQTGTAQLLAIDHASSAETQIASVNTLTTGAAFDFPGSSDYRRFRIATDGLALTSFSATWPDTRPDAPSNVVATALTTDSLEVSWDAVEGAVGYRVSVWTNVVVGASAGTVAWEDSLPGATNGASSTRMSDAKFNACFANAGWTRSDKAGYPTGEDGTIRIGITGDSGWLQTPPIDVASDSGMLFRFHAKIGSSNTNPQMLVERISGNSTDVIGEVTLTSELKEHVLVVSDWNSGDSIRFNSFASGDRRTIIGAVALVSGYSVGTPSPVVVKEVPVADGTATTIDGLPPSVPVFVGVRAIDAAGGPSAVSAGVEVDLANPPPRATLNAWTVSSLADSTYRQDFDSVAGVTMTSGDKDFYNGVTIPFWQAWQDIDAVTKFAYYAGGNQTGAKFVALATNINESTRAFGARGKQDTTMTWGLAFTNETGSTISLTNVSYSAQQWGFANTTNQLLACEYLVTNRLDWIVNFTEGWQTCATTEALIFAAGTHVMPESTAVDYVPAEQIRIVPGEVLYLKWTFHPPAKGSSALMAIDDLAVRFKIPEQGFLMRFVKHQVNEVSP